MRAVPEALTERISTGVTTLAHVWLITLRDGAVYGFTDHDRPLMFDTFSCEPTHGLTAEAFNKGLGLSVDAASVAGVLSSGTLSEGDLTRGLWDGAKVEIFRVDWTEPSLRVHLFSGRIGEVRRGASAFQAELRGLQAPLNKPVGRVFSRYCDADLGDVRCGKVIDTAAFKGAGIVTTVLGSAAFRAAGLEAFGEGWFTRGKLAWDAGGDSEVTAHRLDGGAAVIEVLDAPGAVLTIDAQFLVFAGCDRRFETCRAKFANAVNFRGFPHMPGNDAVQAGPIAGESMDGGSRFS